MREAKVMAKYSHPNLLPLVGVTKHDGKYGMLSPFMVHGQLRKYLDEHEDDLVSDQYPSVMVIVSEEKGYMLKLKDTCYTWS